MNMTLGVLSLIFTHLCLVFFAPASFTSFSLQAPETLSYTGNVQENSSPGTLVEFSPKIATQGDELVCLFKIIHLYKQKPPFQILVADQDKGTAEVRTTQSLDYEEQRLYSFDIEAISCIGTYSERVHLHVQIEDVNEFAPSWNYESIQVALQEGSIMDNLASLSARDLDGSEKFGEICDYKIETKATPFEISKEGVLRNIKPLNYSESHSHIFSVIASDCGHKNSSQLLVIVEVKERCRNGWKGISSLMNYAPGAGPEALYPDANLNVCADIGCTPEKVESIVILKTRHIGKGCDRDTYGLFNQRKLCGASHQAIDLLTNIDNRNVGRTSDKSVTNFNGSMGIDIQEDVFAEVSGSFGKKFTVAMWLKHKANEDEDKQRKEHIICRADDHKKNRHHVALFIRNCKLVLLWRREYTKGEENIFKPAEWRWKLPQVCDNEWHHYAIEVSFPEVDLYVDGEQWIKVKGNPEIIDDWPLHKVADMKTKLTIGACWEGAKGSYKHKLQGYIAGLWFLKGQRENPEVLKCLHQCAESLQIPAASTLETGMEMISNNQGSKIILTSSSARGASNLLHQVAYLNTREFPAPGRRLLSLMTKVFCKIGPESGPQVEPRIITMPEIKTVVNVVSIQEPTVQISGTSNISREYEDFKIGVRVFADIHITMTAGSSSTGEPINGIEKRIDECQLKVSPALNSDHESIEVSDELLESLGIKGEMSPDGALFTGAEMIYNYERLLRQVSYTNKKPAYYLNRQFKIKCFEMNHRFISNKYTQIVEVIHPKNKPIKGVKIGETELVKKAYDYYIKPPNAHQTIFTYGVEDIDYKMKSSPYSIPSFDSYSNFVAILAVICASVLTLILVLGIFKIRADSSRAAKDELKTEDEVQMVWNNSAVKITVNPIEESVKHVKNKVKGNCNRHVDEDSGNDNDEELSDEHCEDDFDHENKVKDESADLVDLFDERVRRKSGQRCLKLDTNVKEWNKKE